MVYLKPVTRGLNEVDAAAYLGVSRSSLRQGRMDGARENRMPPPPFVRLGRKILYLKDDIDRWLELHRQKAGRPRKSTARGRAK